MYRILMAIDEDQRQANEIAASVEKLADNIDDLEILVLHVFRDVELPSQVVIHEQLVDFEEIQHEQREIPAAVTDVVKQLGGRDIDAEIIIERSEDPPSKIISVAEEHDVDNIFIGGRTSSPIGKAMFGNVSQKVLLNTDIPVTVATVPS